MSRRSQHLQTSSTKSWVGLALFSTASAVAAGVEYRSRRAAAFMMPAASELSARLHELHMPVTIVAGDSDAVVDVDAHSRHLHEALPGSRLVVVAGAGHMVHYLAHQQIAQAVSSNEAGSPWTLRNAMNAEPALVSE